MRTIRRRAMFPPHRRTWAERVLETVRVLGWRGDALERSEAWHRLRSGKAFTLDGDVVGEGLTRKLLRMVGIG